ncbi:hypothetical protein ACJX0J_026002 [Zea mays]
MCVVTIENYNYLNYIGVNINTTLYGMMFCQLYYKLMIWLYYILFFLINSFLCVYKFSLSIIIYLSESYIYILNFDNKIAQYRMIETTNIREWSDCIFCIIIFLLGHIIYIMFKELQESCKLFNLLYEFEDRNCNISNFDRKLLFPKTILNTYLILYVCVI